MDVELMNVENAAAVKVISMVAKAEKQLRTFALTLRRMPEVKSASCRVGTYHSGRPFFGVSVGAELEGGDALSWDIHVEFEDNRWSVQANISVNQNIPRSSSETLIEFEERTSTTLDGCIELVDLSLAEIENSRDMLHRWKELLDA